MPPPHSASAIATRFANYWVVDALAGDESLDFYVLQALLGPCPEALAGAPEATRERVALRSLQQVSSKIPAAAAGAAVDGAQSCEDALSRLIKKAEISGKLEKDMLPPFSQDIQEIIHAKKVTLPETSFQLLKGVDPWILHQPCNPESRSHVPPQEDTTDAVGVGTMSPERSPRKAHPSALQHERFEKVVNQDLEDVSASIQPVEKNHTHGDLTLQSASALLSISCNGSNQENNFETSLQPGTVAEDRMAYEEQNVEKGPLEVGGANKGNQTLHDDGCTEASCFSEQENENNRTDVQKDNYRTSIPSSSKDRDGESAKKTSNEEKSEDASSEISVRSKDQDIDDTLEDLSQQDLCIKCGKDGELLTCSQCSLAVHGSCVGPSVTFEQINLFYCPLCSCKKAEEDYLKKKKRYLEALKIAGAYVGTAQASKQHDEQLNGVEPGADKRDGHSNGSDMSQRNNIHQNEAYDLAHPDEEPHQQRKKQKINARDNCYPEEILTEKVPFQNSGPSSMDKHSVLQNNSKARVEDPEKKQQAGDKEAGNDSPSHETTASSQRACDPPLNQDNEADQEDNLISSNQSGGKRSSPPWRNMRHEKESAVPSKSRKVTAKQDQQRKRGSVRPQKRYSNPVGPPGRRSKLAWSEAEVAMLREVLPIFTPQDGAPFPWARMLEYGRHVFNKTRQPLDLRDKWRNMKKAAAAAQ